MRKWPAAVSNLTSQELEPIVNELSRRRVRYQVLVRTEGSGGTQVVVFPNEIEDARSIIKELQGDQKEL